MNRFIHGATIKDASIVVEGSSVVVTDAPCSYYGDGAVQVCVLKETCERDIIIDFVSHNAHMCYNIEPLLTRVPCPEYKDREHVIIFIGL